MQGISDFGDLPDQLGRWERRTMILFSDFNVPFEEFPGAIPATGWQVHGERIRSRWDGQVRKLRGLRAVLVDIDYYATNPSGRIASTIPVSLTQLQIVPKKVIHRRRSSTLLELDPRTFLLSQIRPKAARSAIFS
jgi:hypothetical protein